MVQDNNPGSDDDEGGAIQSYLDSFVPDQALLDSLLPEEDLPGGDDQQPETAAEAKATMKFYIIGDPRAGKGYHTAECGQVRKWRKSLPSNLRFESLVKIEGWRMKPCKQCKPYPLDKQR